MKNVALLVSAIACVNQVIATELTVNIEDLINNRVNDSTKEFGKYVQIELESEHTGQIACKSPSITIVPKEPIENPLNVRFTIPSIIKNDNSQHQYYRIRPGSKKFRNFAVPNLFFHIIFEEVNGAKFILDEDCSFMFENKTDMPSSIKYIDFRAMDTTNVTNMHGMFYGCDNLEYMDVGKFNTSNVTDMGEMFFKCKKLKALDVSGVNTTNVTNMHGMFYGCDNLEYMDVSKFNTSNVTDMGEMFFKCKKLKALDVSGFNTTNVTNMKGMFFGCKSLTSLDVGKFNTSNVTDMEFMFGDCNELTFLDVSRFVIPKGTNIGYMFWCCNNLPIEFRFDVFEKDKYITVNESDIGKINLHGVDTSECTNMRSMMSMFEGCSSLEHIIINNFLKQK